MDTDSVVLEMKELSLFTAGGSGLYIDARLLRGGIYALIGEKDSGKTTFLRLASGLEPVYLGELSLFGESGRAGLAEGRERVGVLADSPSGYRGLNMAQNIRALKIAIGRRRGADDNMHEVFHMLNLTGRNTDRRRLSSLTTEQRLLYGIALAFLNEPELLLLDEPLTGLDPNNRSGLCMLIRSRCGKGMTALLTCHSLELAHSAGIFTDYIFLSEGRVSAQLTAGELAEKMKAQNLSDIQRGLTGRESA